MHAVMKVHTAHKMNGRHHEVSCFSTVHWTDYERWSHRYCRVALDVPLLQTSWNVMAHGDAREGKWRGNWQMEWVASTLHTTSEHGVSSITTADAHISAASSRLNWRPRRFKWTRPFRRKTKLVSARVPSHFKRSLQSTAYLRAARKEIYATYTSNSQCPSNGATMEKDKNCNPFYGNNVFFAVQMGLATMSSHQVNCIALFNDALNC